MLKSLNGKSSVFDVARFRKFSLVGNERFK
jgi:hypothetical protein